MLYTGCMLSKRRFFFFEVLNLWTYFTGQKVLTEESIHLEIYTHIQFHRTRSIFFSNTSTQFRQSLLITIQLYKSTCTANSKLPYPINCVTDISAANQTAIYILV